MISAALLAGGESRRMGRDKCLLEIDGQPLWNRQIDLLRSLSDDVIVVAQGRPKWLPADVRWAADRVSNCGPLGGLEAGLHAALHSQVIALAIDLPAMTFEYLRALQACSTDACGTVPILDEQFQPLSAIYPRSVLSCVTAQLVHSDKSLQRLLRELIASGLMRPLAATNEDRPLFRNLNTPQD